MGLRALIPLLTGYCIVFILPRAYASSEEEAVHCNVTYSDTRCGVPYNASMFVLHCPGAENDDHIVKWQHKLRGHIYDICSINRTCIVEGFEGRLTNDDSGEYYCIETLNSARKTMVTVLAPPQLTSIWNDPSRGFCTPEIARNSCKATNQYYKVNVSFPLAVTFNSVSPTTVRWFINDTELSCPSDEDPIIYNNCIKNVTTHNSSTITILGKEYYSVGGAYKAVVTNAYGSNETIITVILQDDPVPPPKNYLLLKVLLPAGVLLLIVIILVLAIAKLGRMYHASLKSRNKKKKQRQRVESERAALIIQEEGRAGNRNVARPPRQRSHYGSLLRPPSAEAPSETDPGTITEFPPAWHGGELPTNGHLDA